jgi:hypothetical protein
MRKEEEGFMAPLLVAFLLAFTILLAQKKVSCVEHVVIVICEST